MKTEMKNPSHDELLAIGADLLALAQHDAWLAKGRAMLVRAKMDREDAAE
jgi:hypothetical protein